MKKGLILLSLASGLVVSSIGASGVSAEVVRKSSNVGTYAVVNPGGNVTASFSKTMLKNAATTWQVKETDKVYPVGTGMFFAEKVKSRGPWDYKHSYGTSTKYVFGGKSMTGEGLGNLHYGYVGRFGGFSGNLLRSAAGAVQIYSGTALGKWYRTYFDDPNDQYYINLGIGYHDNKNIPTSAKSLLAPTVSNFAKNMTADQDTDLEEILPNGMSEEQFLNILTEEEKLAIAEEMERIEEIVKNDPELMSLVD